MKNEAQKYILDKDTALFAFSVLQKLGTGNISSFDERLKSQKVQYLAQVFEVSPSYSFNLYIHGPYSPGLTSDLYTIHVEKIKPDLSDFVPEILREKFDKLQDFIKDKTNRELELVATLHLFLKTLKWDKELAASKLKKYKQANDLEISYSFKEIEKIL